MELTRTHLLPMPLQAAQDALNNPAVLQRYIPGYESITAAEAGADLTYDIAMTTTVRPIKARFKGHVEPADMAPPRSYTLHFGGQGDAAGFGKGGVQAQLTPEGPTVTRLSYTVTTQTGGKLTQIDSQLAGNAARKLANEFFQRFVAEFGPTGSTGVSGHATPVNDMSATQVISDLVANQLQARGAPPGHAPDVSPALQPRNPWPWIIIAMVAVVAAYLLLYHGA